MSVENLITQHIDIWTSAVQTKSTAGRGTSSKLDLYGIKKLRELILELAVRGKLVPQDPNDEPASVLLQRIAEAKAQLVEEKKLKKPKKPAEISDDEKPFDIPETWKWIRLSEYAQIFSGNAFKSGDFSSEVGVKTIKITNAGVGHLIETDEYLPEEFLTTYSQYRVVKNDLILALTRPYISDGLKVSMCPDSYHNSLLNQRVAAIRAYVNPEYAFFILRSPYVLNTYKNRFSGSGLQPNLKMSDITELVIPICSEQEQHRIVAKVDELMKLCDQLEQQTEASIAAHQVLVETLLATLTNSSNAEELMENWQRISAHFDTLFTTIDAIDQLKQTILQLAVMGKLVPQNPADEPASELLKRIAKEKAQLVKEGKIKKQKALPPITDDEKPFELPNGWEWCYLQDLFSVVTDGDHQAPPKSDEGIPFLVIGNLNTGHIQFEGCNYVPAQYFDKLDWTRQPSKGDLLYTVTGSYGIPVLVIEEVPFCVQRHVAILNSTADTPVEYIQYVLRSKYSFDFATSVATGIAQKTVPLTGLRKMPIPLPPLKERAEILQMIAALIRICEQLKVNIRDSQTNQLHLTDAIVEQAV